MVDPGGEPLSASGLDRSRLIELFRGMTLARAAEERLARLREMDRGPNGSPRFAGLHPPTPGLRDRWRREALLTGSAHALRRRTDGTGDLLGRSSTGAAALIPFGVTLPEFFEESLRWGGPGGAPGSDFRRGLLGSGAARGCAVDVLAGATLAFRLRGQARVGIAYTGWAAAASGAWHEGMCFAAAQRCPLIVVVEVGNTPSETGPSPPLEEWKTAYGARGESVDGGEVLADYEATRRAAERAREGGGVALIEGRVPLARGELADASDPSPDPSDPVARYRRRLTDGGWVGDGELEAVARASEEAVEEAVGEVLRSRSRAAASTGRPTVREVR